MLGLLLIYFIGKTHYRLAVDHGRGPWPFALLGVATYYAGSLLFGMLIGITIELFSPGSIDEMNDLVLSLIAVPFGLLTTAGLYYLLKHSWEGHRKDARSLMGEEEVFPKQEES